MTRKGGRAINGWLIIDKPLGLSSTAVVGRVRRAFDARKAGHGGTLDPLATGVLPVAFGHATCTVPYVMDGTKRYCFTLTLGESRDTDDAEGAVVQRSAVRPDTSEVVAALASFRGEIWQVPPVYSALKLNGQRAYDLARRGQAPQMAPRRVSIERLELVKRHDDDRLSFEVQCGKGFYIRSLARDIAQACGTVGYVSMLRRTQVGPFTESDAISLDKISIKNDKETVSDQMLLPVTTALADIPALAVTMEEAVDLSFGRALPLSELGDRLPQLAGDSAGIIRAMEGERVVALCFCHEGMLRPRRVLQP